MSDLAKRVRVMLALQDEMNLRVDDDWREREREWWRAIWIECAELMDHYGGWKWWKHSACDPEQVMLEIVDVWHFGLSIRIAAHETLDAAAAGIADELARPARFATFHDGVEALARTALVEHDMAFSVVPFLLEDIGRGLDELYASYVGKNVLNIFRQDYGYRDGSYRKTWADGREDNEHLAEIVAALDLGVDDPRPLVRAALEARYPDTR